VRLLLFAGVACAAFCQDCTTAAERLHSDSPREKAWGAHLAAECRLPSLAKEIGDDLVRLHPESLARLTSDSAELWMAYALLDALIQMRAQLDEPVLASIMKGFPPEAVVLMLRNPHVSSSLLAEVRPSCSGSAEWVALSNTLAAMRAPGYAAMLFSEVQFTHGVWLSDSGDAPVGDGMAGSILGGIPQFKVPLGFPPVTRYRLTSQAASDDELFSDGPSQVFIKHIVVAPGIETTPAWPPESFCLQCLRIGYLARLAGLSAPEVRRAIDARTSIRWSTMLNLNAEISHAIAEQIQAIIHLAKLLLSGGALLPSEFELPVMIQVGIYDQRANQTQPIPAVGPVTFSIHP
jgi:hypothetical protein